MNDAPVINGTNGHTFRYGKGSIIDGYEITEPLTQAAVKEIYRVTAIPELFPSDLPALVLKLYREPAKLESPTTQENLRLLDRMAKDGRYDEAVVKDPRVKKFFKEVNTLMSVQAVGGHPNVARIYDRRMIYKSGDEEAHLYFVEEFVEGKTLTQLIHEAAPNEAGLRRLPVADAIDIFSQISSGVNFLHDKLKMAHCDIKGDNIIVTPEGRAVLTDFGNARIMNWADYKQRGSILYRSPEELLGEPGNLSSDVWAMTVLFYQTITGKYPFETTPSDWSGLTPEQFNEALAQLKMNIMFTPVSIDRRYYRQVSQTLQDAIHTGLKHRPEDRITMEKLSQVLKEENDALQAAKTTQAEPQT